VYDLAGNMVVGPKTGAGSTKLHYVYDAWNRLVAVKNDNGGSPGSTLATYAYDGLNRRVSKATGGHTDDSYFNEGWQVLETRRDGDPDAREQFVWEETYVDTPAVRFLDANTDGDYADAGDNTLYYLTDPNHNVFAVYNPATHSMPERYTYDPYGAVSITNSGTVVGTSSVGNDVMFAGYRLDAETGMYDVRNRQTLHPTLGAWGQRDFAGYVEGANLYQYVSSRPTSATDPTGLRQWPWGAGELRIDQNCKQSALSDLQYIGEDDGIKSPAPWNDAFPAPTNDRIGGHGMLIEVDGVAIAGRAYKIPDNTYVYIECDCKGNPTDVVVRSYGLWPRPVEWDTSKPKPPNWPPNWPTP
jgi:RHS repeat-associated protein